MKTKGVVVCGALAGFGLLSAYFTWQRPKSNAERGEVIVLDLSKKQLEKVRYEDKRRWVELSRGPETLGEDIVLITEKQKGGKAVADPHAGLGLPPMGDGDPNAADLPPKTLKGSPEASKAFASLSPLRATRTLGKLDDKKLEELGIAKSDRKLVVSSSKGEKTFTVGAPTGGVGAAYLRADDGTVFVVTPNLLSDLEFAMARVADRRLHAFKPEEADAIQVAVGEKARKFVQQNEQLVPENRPGQADEYARNWHDRVNRLNPTELLGQGVTPAGGEPKPELKVEYGKGGKSLGFLEVARADNALFGRTEHTLGWVKLPPSAGDVVLEAAKVVESK